MPNSRTPLTARAVLRRGGPTVTQGGGWGLPVRASPLMRASDGQLRRIPLAKGRP